ncbi:hypothetical protein EV421DRAFT_1740927 [Armillaria borealis]|uniref:Uncharacterized protein n=1 Tax=Armillaria borealis TaxID=47425 RepID=A0AA39J2T3_9AGAR|nr:hypothetical protein EV421DRAFT_1740927 [Armillaria borealis]
MSRTPPKGTREGREVVFTLQSRGTASNNRIVLPVQVPLMRMLLGVSAGGNDAVDLTKAQFDADQLFDEIPKDAIDFCNSILPDSSNLGLVGDVSKNEIFESISRCRRVTLQYNPGTLRMPMSRRGTSSARRR